MAHTRTQNVLGRVQTERNAATAKCRELQTMLDDMYAKHDALQAARDEHDHYMTSDKHEQAIALDEIDTLAPGGVERWLEADAAKRASETPTVVDDDCPI